MKSTASLTIEVYMHEIASKFASSSWRPSKIELLGSPGLSQKVLIHYSGVDADPNDRCGG